MPSKLGMIMTLNNSINNKPSSRATLQPGYNQTSTSLNKENRLQTRTKLSSANRYSMSSLYSAPRWSGSG